MHHPLQRGHRGFRREEESELTEVANIPCMNEDGNQASFIISNIDTGDVISVCGECFPLWVLSVAEAMTAMVAPENAPEAAETTQGASTAKKKAPPRRRAAPKTPVQDDSAALGEDDALALTE